MISLLQNIVVFIISIEDIKEIWKEKSTKYLHFPQLHFFVFHTRVFFPPLFVHFHNHLNKTLFSHPQVWLVQFSYLFRFNEFYSMTSIRSWKWFYIPYQREKKNSFPISRKKPTDEWSWFLNSLKYDEKAEFLFSSYQRSSTQSTIFFSF